MKKREIKNEEMESNVDSVSKMKAVLNERKKRIKTVQAKAILIALCVVLLLIGVFNKKADVNSFKTQEFGISEQYEIVKDGEDVLEETPDVKFSAFFLRDLDEDGQSEKIKGTCKKIGEEDDLYINLELLSDGQLKNPKIEVLGHNFFLKTSISKDDVIKNDCISDNTTQIELNDLNGKAQKLMYGIVRSGNYSESGELASALNNNINNYSRKDNKIIFTAKYVKDGKEIDIRKEIDITVDWYVDLAVKENSNEATCEVSSKVIKESDKVCYEINVDTSNIDDNGLLKNNKITGKIPQINSKNPINVKIDKENVVFNYDKITRRFEIVDESVIDDNGEIISNVSESSTYNLEVEYEENALENESDNKEITVKTEHEVYNNDNVGFENPIKIASKVNIENTVGEGEEQGETVNFVIWYTLNDNWPSTENVVQMYNDVYPGYDNYATVYDGDINITDWYSGYIFESLNIDGGYVKDGVEYTTYGEDIDFIPEAIYAGSIVTVNYETPKTAYYRVEHYLEGVLQSADTESFSTQIAASATTINLDTSKFKSNKYKGYKLDSTRVPTSVAEGGTVKLYYEIDPSQTKKLDYVIWYCKNSGMPAASDVVHISKTVQVLESDFIPVAEGDLNITDRFSGYLFQAINIDGWYIKDGVEYDVFGENITFVPDAIKSGTIVAINYETPKAADYTIEYYKNGVLQSADTEIISTQIPYSQTSINLKVSDFNANKYTGYKLVTSSVPASVSIGGTVKLEYVVDETQKKDIWYHIWYTKNGALPEAGQSITVEKTVLKADSDYLTVEDGDINITDRFSGYIFAGLNVDGRFMKDGQEYNISSYIDYLPDSIKNGALVTVLYETPKTISYNVEYYLDGVLEADDTETVSQIVPKSHNGILTVDKAAINLVDKYYGYKVVNTTIPDTVSDGTTIKVYYEIDESQTKDVSCTIEFYKEDELVEELVITNTIHVLDDDIVVIDRENIEINNRYEGYELFWIETIRSNVVTYVSNMSPVFLDELPLEVIDGTILGVFYDKRTDLEYKVNYINQNDGSLLAETKTVTDQTYGTEVTETAIDISGYNKVNTQETIEIDVENNVINFYYTPRTDLSYKVEYYFDGVIDNSLTETFNNQTYNETISTYKDKVKTGYKFESATTPITIGLSNNVIKVYYVIDPSQTKELTYTVEFYKDGVLSSADTINKSKTAHVLEYDITIDKEEINIVDKYYGYKYSHIYIYFGMGITRAPEPTPERWDTIPDAVTNGTYLRVYYVTDPDQTKELTYTVEYYKDNVLVPEDTQVEVKTVQVLQTDIIWVNENLINLEDKYDGYEFKELKTVQKTRAPEPEGVEGNPYIPDSVVSGTTLEVYFEKRTDLTYTVEYYFNGIKDNSLTEAVNNQTFGTTVNTYTDKVKVGYKLESQPTPIVIGTGNNVLKVYYVTDDAQTKTLKYTVKYYKDGVHVTSDDQVHEKVVQALQNEYLEVNAAEINTKDKYLGYKFDKLTTEGIDNQIPSNTEGIPEIANNNGIINVYYVLDESQTKELSYTLEFYRDTDDGVYEPYETLTFREIVHVLAEDIIAVDTNIELENRYEGYYFENILVAMADLTTYGLWLPLEELPSEVYDGAIIEIYYGKRTDLSYVVNYLEQGTNKTLADSKFVDNQTYLDVIAETAIDITGYNAVNTTETLTIGIENNAIDFYYTPRTDLSYKVEYYYDGELDNSLTEVRNNQIYGTQVNSYTDKVKEGYKLEKAPETITIGVNENVLKVYYIKDNAQTKTLSYTIEFFKEYSLMAEDTLTFTKTVHVLDEDIIEVDKENIEIENKYEGFYFSHIETSMYDIATYVGGQGPITLDELPTEVFDGAILNVMYFKRNDLSYKVNYLEQGTNKELAEAKIVDNQVYQDIVTENAIDIFGYNKVNTQESVEITTGENVINFYYTVRKDFKYTINHVDRETGELIADSKVVTNAEYGKTYRESIIAIEGYSMIEDPEVVFTVKEDNKEYNLYYTKRKDLSYKVEYYFNNVIDESLTDIFEGQVYKTVINSYTDKVKAGYKLDHTSGDLIIGVNENILKVYYVIDDSQTKDLSYTIDFYKDGEFVEEDTISVIKEVQLLEDNKIEVDKENVEIVNRYDGYYFDIIQVPRNGMESNTEGGAHPLWYMLSELPDEVYSGTTIDVLYNKRTDLSYVVNYLDADTGNLLADSKFVDNQAYLDRITENAIDIFGYNKVNVQETIDITTGENVINFYYTVRNDFKYTINYIDKETGELIAESKVVTDAIYGKSYRESVIDIDGYNIANDPEIVFTVIEDNKIYELEYTKRTDLSYKTEYYYNGYHDTNRDTVVKNQTFKTVIDTYVDRPEDGYIFEKVEGLPLTIGTGENIIKVYYAVDDKQTKELSYTVEYYKDGVKVDEDVERKIVQLLAPDTMAVNKDKINVQDKYEGYYFDSTEPNVIPDTVNSGDVIKVNYTIRNDLSYVVNYLEEGTNIQLANSKIVEGKTYQSEVTETAMDIFGYSKVNEQETIRINIENNIINFYYTKRNDFVYNIHYAEFGTDKKLAESKVISNLTFGESFIETAIDIEGYKADSLKTALTVDQEIKNYTFTYTKRTDLSYRVEYYYNGVLDSTLTDVFENQTYNSEITTYVDKVKSGYKLEKASLTTIGVGENIVKIYYVADDAQTKELSYTVEYYKDGVKVDEEIEKITVQLLAPNTMTVDKDKINIQDKYEGYYFASTEPNVIPDTVNSGDIIKVNYTIRTDLSYRVEYYFNNEIDESLTYQFAGQTYDSEITTYVDKVKAGYKFDHATTPIRIGVGENVIKVYYVTDEAQTKELSYTVEYYKDGVKVDEEVEKTTVQLLSPNSMTVNKEKINTKDKYEGYYFDSTEPNVIPDTVNSGDVIKVNYTIRRDLSYTVKYYYNGIQDESFTEVFENNMFGEEITTYPDKVKNGYQLDYDTTPIRIGVNENIIEVYYATDDKQTKELHYTVEYYKDGMLVETEKETTRVQYLEPEIMAVNKEKINIQDKYEGYYFDSTEPNTIPEMVNSGDVIKVNYRVRRDLSYKVEYYFNNEIDETLTDEFDNQAYNTEIKTYQDKVKPGYKLDTATTPIVIGVNENVVKVYYVTDEKQTKELSYTVEYYKDGVLDITDEVKINVQLLEPNVLVVNKEKINMVDKYDGYTFVSTDPENIPDTINSGEVIKVHYEIRNDLSYIVNYLEEGTNVSIADTKFVDNQTFNDVVVETAIDIKGYNKLEEEKSITISTNENEIIFYYTKVNDLEYTVKYLEEGTEKVLAEEKTVENRTYLEEITEDAIDIEGYTKVNPSETIIIDVNKNEIIFYYKKVQGLTYIVKYLEKDTNESLIEDKVVEGNAFKDEISETSVNIDGYIAEEPTSQTIVIGMNENIITFYYTKRADLEYTIKYINKDTNEEIKERVVKDNQVFNSTVKEVAPNITGYNSINNEETITITTGENEIIFYYEKLQGLVYTVKYLEKDTEVALANEKVVDKNEFEDMVTENAIDIEGYKAEEPKTQSIVIGIEENSITFYYTKRTDLEYRVEYYYDEVLDESKTEYIDNQTYQTVIDTYNDKLLEGYKLDKVENIPLTIGVSDNVIKVYYVREEFEYRVEYYYDNILDESNTVTGKAKYKEVIDTYEEKAKYEYDFVKVENLPLEISDKPESNVIRVYYELKDSTITVKYVDKDSQEEILEAKVIDGKVFDSYNLENEIKEIEGYTLVEKPEKLAVSFTVEPQEFTFYYKKNTKVIVRYLEEDDTLENDEDNKVLEEIVIDGYVGKGYATIAKEFENYNFVSATENTSGTMTEDTIIVKYYYAKIKFGITVKHIDVKSNELIETNVYELPIGEEYKVEPKEFEGYDLVETMIPENAEGIVENEPIEVKYYYIRKTSVRVEYIDSYSNEKIVKDVVVEGHEGDNYKVEADYIEHYKLDDTKLPQNAAGTMDVTINEDGSVNTETVVKYYYIIEAKVVEKHIDIMTDKVMREEVHNGFEGEKYEITPKQFDGYDVVKTKLPNNREGKLTKEVIEVRYYYIRKATVTVEHINMETGEKITDIAEDGTVIDPNVIIEGHEGDEYNIEPHNFKKYKVVEDKLPDNAIGMMKVIVDEDGNVINNTVVIYYYVAKVEVVEKHIDIVTGKEIEEEKVHEGNEGDHYEIPSKEYEGYDIVEDKKPENAEGTMSKDVVEVKYYYIRRTKVIVEYIDKETGEIVKETIEIRGHEGDEYESEELEVDGYKLVKEEYPENSKGTMEVKVNEDGSVETITYVRYYYEKVGQTEQPEEPNKPEQPENPSKPEEPNVPEQPEENKKPDVQEEPVKKKGKVVVKYLEKGTNKVLAKEKTIEGNVDDDYTTEAIVIKNYTLDNKEPTNKKGKIKEGTTEVVYYYFLTKTPAKDDVSLKPVDPNKPENEDPFDGKLPSTGTSAISNIILVAILIIVVANIIIFIRRKVISKKDN